MHHLARLAINVPGLIVTAAVLLAVGAGLYGSSVTKSLSACGFRTRLPSHRAPVGYWLTSSAKATCS